jgi:hypothetical protein
MFDATTAALLRSAPAMPGLNPANIPALLTRQYANLAAARLRGADDNLDQLVAAWSLERLADTYEILTSLTSEVSVRRPAAFVAGTAQQMLARRQAVGTDPRPPNIDRDRVDPSIAAAILFLSAEQYADANEASYAITTSVEGQIYEAEILSENIADLARGRLNEILARGARWRRGARHSSLDERALAALLETLVVGVELLAANLLHEPPPDATAGRYDSARSAFETVLELSATSGSAYLPGIAGATVLTYAGPHHLASLLLAASDGLALASLFAVPPPQGAKNQTWNSWLKSRAKLAPFIWPNHREAIAREFYQSGVSSVVVLPTGAGKTTVSSLKIAGVLACGKKVVFLAPTHALVDQLTVDLQEMFPADVMGSVVSSDFDLLLLDNAQLRDIEVMTPERCLAMLSFAPEAFQDVGLLVFDECHLLSPEIGRIRRALDAMLCVLGFNHVAPDADMLFLSAMLKNVDEMSEWIAALTGRPCVPVDLPWKPSRQARGVIIYDNAELTQAKELASKAQGKADIKAGKKAGSLRQAAKNQLCATPYAIWGLQHNWLTNNKAACVTNAVSDTPVTLAGAIWGNSVRLTPNANEVAVHLAVAASKTGLKSIVFVNTKADAITVAAAISKKITDQVKPTEFENGRWEALEKELGGLKHAVISGPAIAVPHNSAMLRLERDLCEGMFKRAEGARTIVATPTLAQGLNLPAHLAILAGDKRADASGRESLKAHEILNAAARAGRAGHLANGLVLLIPEPIISFTKKNSLSGETVRKLKSILPEDDHCVLVSDPLEVVLDRLMAGEATDVDVQYTVNRFAVLREVEGGTEEPTRLFDLNKSLGAYFAKKRNTQATFDTKVVRLKNAITTAMPGSLDNATAVLATQSGLSAQLLMNLRDRIRDQIGELPITIDGWLAWTIAWLDKDTYARDALLGDASKSIIAIVGKKATEHLEEGDIAKLLPGIRAWITGQPLKQIEVELGGDPDSTSSRTKRLCPKARDLVGTIIPRGLSFTLGLISKVAKDLEPFASQPTLNQQVIEALSAAIRKGYDTPEKLFHASQHKSILSRVQLHEAFANRATTMFGQN